MPLFLRARDRGAIAGIRQLPSRTVPDIGDGGAVKRRRVVRSSGNALYHTGSNCFQFAPTSVACQ
jgi:hypothetical protein